MTEESDDDSDPNSIVVHKITWRSENLDKRLSVLTTTDLLGNVARKVRKPCCPSTTTPPLDAPVWAIKKVSDATTEGVLKIFFNYHWLSISLLFP